MPAPARADYATCTCGKRGYHDRKAAKQAAKTSRQFYDGRHFSVYRCDVTGLFHTGHTPAIRLKGGL